MAELHLIKLGPRQRKTVLPRQDTAVSLLSVFPLLPHLLGTVMGLSHCICSSRSLAGPGRETKRVHSRFSFLSFLSYLGLHPGHVEVPCGLRVESELQLMAYTTATAMWGSS